jgi:hypothetical protein
VERSETHHLFAKLRGGEEEAAARAEIVPVIDATLRRGPGDGFRCALLILSYVVGPFAELRRGNRLRLNDRYLQISIVHSVGSGVQTVPQQGALGPFCFRRALAIRTSVARSGSFLPVT